MHALTKSRSGGGGYTATPPPTMVIQKQCKQLFPMGQALPPCVTWETLVTITSNLFCWKPVVSTAAHKDDISTPKQLAERNRTFHSQKTMITWSSVNGPCRYICKKFVTNCRIGDNFSQSCASQCLICFCALFWCRSKILVVKVCDLRVACHWGLRDERSW